MNSGSRFGPDLLYKVRIFFRWLIRTLRDPDSLSQFHLKVDERLDGFVAKKNGLEHITLTDDISTAFDHDNAGL